MQAYGAAFARVYNARWSGFARRIAPQLEAFYAASSVGHENKDVLDLCCGTGQLALHFLERGYSVTGIDLSEPMLHYARQNAAAYVVSGQATFIQADAASFHLDRRFGLVLSTFDALNHLDGIEALGRCFPCVRDVLVEGGLFMFDLNTRRGLDRWNGIAIEDSADLMLITRGLLDAAGGRAYCRISGFVRLEDGFYERFEGTAYNTVFDMEAVRQMLLDTGFPRANCARLEDLATPLDQPEQEQRIFFVASG